MIRSGDTIHNAVTGESITFHQTSADTNGEAVVVECTVQPDGFVAAAHVHPSQTERFSVISGRLGMKAGREKLSLERGDVAVVEPGTPHKFWNMGDDEVPVRLRGAAGAAVRVAARDDVRARRRRQDEQEGHAEPVPPRGDRSRALRHRAAAATAGLAAAGSARSGRAARPLARLSRHLRAADGHARAAGGVTMKRRLYFILLVLALLLLAIPGFAVRAARRAAAPLLGFA